MKSARSPSTTVLSAAVLSIGLLLTACGGGDEGSVATEAPAAVTPAPVVDGSGSGAVGGAGLIALDASTSCDLPDFRASLLQQINAARTSARSCGSTALPAVNALAWNDRLFSAAARHSRDMAQNNYFSHTGLDGRSSSQRISAEGYAWSWSGENIAAGQSSVATVMNGWLASEGHCRNIMRAEYRDVAVSCVQRSGSPYGRYWTMVLARPR
jgi:uncharacterized protein YkwD